MEESAPHLPFTERERQIARLVARGLDNFQISEILRTSENAVKFHLSSTYSKFELNKGHGSPRVKLTLLYLSTTYE